MQPNHIFHIDMVGKVVNINFDGFAKKEGLL